MSSGEDTTDLKRKLGQLQVEVMNAHTQFKMPLHLRLISSSIYGITRTSLQLRLVYSSSAAHPTAAKDKPNGASARLVVFAVPPGY